MIEAETHQMDKDKLIAALNDMGGRKVSEVEAIVKGRNAALESRIAAIMLTVAGSDLSVADATMELIFSLTYPNWESRIDDPFTATFGRDIVRATRDSSAQRPDASAAIKDVFAWNFVQQAKDPAAVPSEAADFFLRAHTGKAATWWIEWIRAELGK
jgi:hypothetical protein